MHRYFDKSLDIHFVIYFGNEKKGVVVAIVEAAVEGSTPFPPSPSTKLPGCYLNGIPGHQ